MKQGYPFVSVVLPTYNEERYIRACIESLINQTYPRDYMEWIIVDGNSTDKTQEIVKEYSKIYPIKLLINEKRKTPISLNMGIKEAKGDYIIRFDAHASFPPDYIEKCIDCLEYTGADNVGGWVETRAEGYIGEAIAKMLSSKFGVGGSSFRTEQKSGYVDTVPFGAFRREVFNRVGLFNEKLLRSEDNDINARIIENGGKIYLSEEIHSIYYCRDKVSAVLKQGLQNGNALFRTMIINPKAMKLRHFIPFLFLLSLMVLPWASIFSSTVACVFAAEMICYTILNLYFSFVKKDRKLGFVTLWLYPLFHICYGAGSLLGIVGIEMY